MCIYIYIFVSRCAIQCNAMQCSAMPCNAMQCIPTTYLPIRPSIHDILTHVVYVHIYTYICIIVYIHTCIWSKSIPVVKELNALHGNGLQQGAQHLSDACFLPRRRWRRFAGNVPAMFHSGYQTRKTAPVVEKSSLITPWSRLRWQIETSSWMQDPYI